MPPRTHHSFRPQVEGLEDRQLLAGQVTAPPILLNRPAVAVQAPTAKVTLSADEQKIVTLTNDYRRSKGRSALRVNRLLVKAALRHAQNLIACGCLGDRDDPHILRGKRVSDRVKAAGYAPTFVGENIAYQVLPILTVEELAGLPNPIDQFAEFTVNGWIGSPGHRRNLLERKFNQIGVGVATVQSEFSKFFIAVQVFGRG